MTKDNQDYQTITETEVTSKLGWLRAAEMLSEILNGTYDIGKAREDILKTRPKKCTTPQTQ